MSISKKKLPALATSQEQEAKSKKLIPKRQDVIQKSLSTTSVRLAAKS
jgi:hypothetical protein